MKHPCEPLLKNLAGHDETTRRRNIIRRSKYRLSFLIGNKGAGPNGVGDESASRVALAGAERARTLARAASGGADVAQHCLALLCGGDASIGGIAGVFAPPKEEYPLSRWRSAYRGRGAVTARQTRRVGGEGSAQFPRRKLANTHRCRHRCLFLLRVR